MGLAPFSPVPSSGCTVLCAELSQVRLGSTMRGMCLAPLSRAVFPHSHNQQGQHAADSHEETTHDEFHVWLLSVRISLVLHAGRRVMSYLQQQACHVVLVRQMSCDDAGAPCLFRVSRCSVVEYEALAAEHKGHECIELDSARIVFDTRHR